MTLLSSVDIFVCALCRLSRMAAQYCGTVGRPESSQSRERTSGWPVRAHDKVDNRRTSYQRLVGVEVGKASTVLGVDRGVYRLSPRGGRPVMDWCLNDFE